MPVDMAALTADLTAESAELDEILTALSLAQWDIATPAVSWTVKDQVTHLAWFDEAAVTAAREPDRFREEAARLGDAVGGLADRIAPQYRAMPPADVLAWFRDTRQRYVDAFAALAPDTRLPWYGPPMSAASSVTARLMETWAHGQDVVDAIGATRQPTDRLRHIAHLGVRTLGWSFRVHGQLEPNMPVRV